MPASQMPASQMPQFPRPSIERLADDAPVAHYSPTREAAYAALRVRAWRTVRTMIKMRARAYAMRPRELDATIMHGLSDLSPRRLVQSLLDTRRWLGFGGEVPALNLRGALLYSRFARAKANQLSHRRVASHRGRHNV